MSVTAQQITQDDELFSQVRLIRSDGIGPVSFNRLINRCGCAQEAVAMLEAAARKGTAKTQLADPQHVWTELEQAAELNIRFLFQISSQYPKSLNQISDAPPVLAIRGDETLLSQQAFAIVGARNCSAGGAKITSQISQNLGESGFVVVSGMARGIDRMAHIAAMETGTIACMAGGVDVIYPHENKDVYEALLDSGLIISEMAIGTKPQARHFPRRNRIISGLSTGLLVIEAAKRSGSLITADYAANQNRDVFAVPGSPLDPRSQGCNQLIRDGAILTQTAADIINEYDGRLILDLASPTGDKLSHETERKKAPEVTAFPPKTEASSGGIMTLLSPTPVHIDELVRLSGRPANELLVEFTNLELLGEVTRHPGGKFSRVSPKNE